MNEREDIRNGLSISSHMKAGSTFYAGFWKRVGANAIDWFIFIVLSLPILWINSQSKMAAIILALPWSLSGVLYYVVFHAKRGQTPGKMAVGIRVVEHESFLPISVRQATMRSIVDLVFSLITSVGTILTLANFSDILFNSMSWIEKLDYEDQSTPFLFEAFQWIWLVWALSEVVVMLFNRRKRALHDFIAGTVVVQIGVTPPAS